MFLVTNYPSHTVKDGEFGLDFPDLLESIVQSHSTPRSYSS